VGERLVMGTVGLSCSHPATTTAPQPSPPYPSSVAPSQVLVDAAVRELTDLPPDSPLRIAWLRLLRGVLLNTQWSAKAGGGRYREREVRDAVATMIDSHTSRESRGGTADDVVYAEAEHFMLACAEVF